MMLVEKAKTERIKDHKIIPLTLKQGSEMNNLFIISISFFPGISQTILGDPGAVSRVDKLSPRTFLTAPGSPRMITNQFFDEFPQPC